jgi:DNA-binding NarL/FixJ family response regulator
MKTLRTVVAEDSGILRASLVKFLKVLPHVAIVGEAINGEEALKCVDELAPDLLILDISMPKVNGWQVLSQLQERQVPTQVIIFATYVNSHFAPMVQERGVYAYLSKDNPQALVEAITELATKAPQPSS